MALRYGDRLANSLHGTAEDDMLAGLGGNDTLNGGAGVDTAWYSGLLAGYRFAVVNGRLTVQDINALDGQDGTDSLGAIEKLQFSNAQLQLSLVPSEFRANTTTQNTQDAPAIAALADGGYVVTWQSLGQDGSDYGIYAQRYDAQGLAAGSEFQVNTTTDNGQFAPTVTGLADGGFVVSWTGLNIGTMSFDIFAQRYDEHGVAAGVEFVVNATVLSNQTDPAIAALADGGFVVSWTGGDDIFAQTYNAQGEAASSEITVNTTTAGSQSQPTIAALADGGFVVSWVSVNPNPMLGDLFYAQRYDAQGAAAGAEILVGASPVSGQTNVPIAALSTGGFVLFWAIPDEFNFVYVDIYAQRYDAQGDPEPGQFLVQNDISVSNSFSFIQQMTLAATALADGGFVVSWSGLAGLGTEINVYAKRYDAQGTASEVFQVNTTTAMTDLASGAPTPTVAALDDGGFVVSWTSNQDGVGKGVYAQRYDAQGVAVSVQKLTGTANADAINLGDGQALIVDGAGGNDTLSGAGADDSLLGGLGNDRLNGNAGNDNLDGGSGNDIMVGGIGDDLYVVNSVTDVVTELAGAGNDAVQASVSFTLAPTLENLELTGTGNISGTGNANGNFMLGNSGNNVLNGMAGADIMAGGAGDDTYHVDNVFDFVSENAAEGTDFVAARVTFTLPANVEHLLIMVPGIVDGTGNALNNTMQGNTGANVLDGGDGDDGLIGAAGNDVLIGGAGDDLLQGNAGNDFLQGGAGSDTFLFIGAPLSASTNVDHISDFLAVDDKIYLYKSVFTALDQVGVELSGEEFRSGMGQTTALDQDDRIIYNTVTGDLYYDRDGSAAAFAAVKFAVLDGAPAITSADFFVM